MSREAFDAQGVLAVEFMTPGRAGLLLAMLTGKSRNYSKQQLLKLFREHGLMIYDTPLGRLVHEEDVQECARRIGWWRKEPVQGYLGGSPWCARSGDTVLWTGKQPKIHKCQCGFEFTPKTVAPTHAGPGGGSYKVPTHKSRLAHAHAREQPLALEQ